MRSFLPGRDAPPTGGERSYCIVDQGEVILQAWQEQWRLARQSEDQRASMTNIILLISSVAFGFVAQQGIRDSIVAVTIPLTLLGAFGAMAAAKYHERFRFHVALARPLWARLGALYPDAQLLEESLKAREVHERRYPLITRMGLYQMWIALPLMIAVTGLVLTIVALFS